MLLPARRSRFFECVRATRWELQWTGVRTLKRSRRPPVRFRRPKQRYWPRITGHIQARGSRSGAGRGYESRAIRQHLPPAGQHSRLKAWRHRWHEAHRAAEDACGRVLPRPAGRGIMPGPVRHINSCTARRRRPIVTSAASGSQAAVTGRPQLAAGEQLFRRHLTGGAADRLGRSAGGGSICARPGTSAAFDRAAYSSAVGRAHRAADLGISADTRAGSSISTDARAGSGCC